MNESNSMNVMIVHIPIEKAKHSNGANLIKTGYSQVHEIFMNIDGSWGFYDSFSSEYVERL